ncbi:MAG TPA: Nramp family divalent metal transporter [Candidatus Limnocylindrales bacterium]
MVAPTVGEVLRRGRLRGGLRLLGPGFVAAVAYVDPGNVATNVTAGARHGYLLLWVVVAANLMAVVVQHLSSKLGLVTGESLPQLCRARYPVALNRLLWVQAELVAIATDLAEFVGAALAIHLLTGAPLLVGAVATGAASFGLLALPDAGYRRFERAVSAALAVILVGFGVGLVVVDVVPGDLVDGLVPRPLGGDALLLAVGIVGATVMPHVVYLHSALMTDRFRSVRAEELRTLLRYTRIDVLLAMLTAGAVNVAMLVFAAAAFSGTATPIAGLEDAHRATGLVLGSAAAAGFALALLASGLSSSSVGTLAGQVVMAGFIGRRIPLVLRRAVTMAPALACLAAGLDPTDLLIVSQVVLSFGIPFALVPLVRLTASRRLMGEFANNRSLTAFASLIAIVVVGMNVLLLASQAGLV